MMTDCVEQSSTRCVQLNGGRKNEFFSLKKRNKNKSRKSKTPHENAFVAQKNEKMKIKVSNFPGKRVVPLSALWNPRYKSRQLHKNVFWWLKTKNRKPKAFLGKSILRRGWVGVRVEHCYNLGAPPGGGGGNNLNLTFKGSGSTQP